MTSYPVPAWVVALDGQRSRGASLICHLPLAVRSAEPSLESPEVWLTPTNVTGSPSKGGDSVGNQGEQASGCPRLCVLVSKYVYLWRCYRTGSWTGVPVVLFKPAVVMLLFVN